MAGFALYGIVAAVAYPLMCGFYWKRFTTGRFSDVVVELLANLILAIFWLPFLLFKLGQEFAQINETNMRRN